MDVAVWFSAGRVVDLVAVLILAEAGIVLAIPRRALAPGRPARRELLPTLASGLGLVLALRAALAGAGLAWIGAALAVALVAHCIDLRRRW